MQKIKIVLPLFLVLSITLINSCVKDVGKPEAITGCDTVNSITYSGQVGGILKTYCEFAGCHNGSNIKGGAPDYTTYSGVQPYAVGGNGSDFWSYVIGPNHTMPLAGTPGPASVSPCDLAILAKWVRLNAPQ